MPSRSTRASGAWGLYVHFPFCAHHCFYCDFAVATTKQIPHGRYTDALLSELHARRLDVQGPPATLYLGGGTPSLWSLDELARFLGEVPAAEGAEITLEANPTEVTPERAAAWRRLGINRLSLGVQALSDELLRAVDRDHDAARAHAAIAAVRDGGFRSYSIDLMFGLPGQGLQSWLTLVDRVIELRPPHLSVYALTVEPRTRLGKLVAIGRHAAPDDGLQARMMFGARARLRAAGYEHYEVSSYALPGHHAVHNSRYWDMTPFLGIGAGAHGFVAPRRWSNLRPFRRYLDAVEAGELPTADEERLDADTLAFERLMTGLRRLDVGVDLGADGALFAAAIAEQQAKGYLTIDQTAEGTRVRLTDEGLRLMDGVLLSLHP